VLSAPGSVRGGIGPVNIRWFVLRGRSGSGTLGKP